MSTIASYFGSRLSSCYTSLMSLGNRDYFNNWHYFGNYFGNRTYHCSNIISVPDNPDDQYKLQRLGKKYLSASHQTLLFLTEESKICEIYSYPEEKGNNCTECKNSTECRLLFIQDISSEISLREDL